MSKQHRPIDRVEVWRAISDSWKKLYRQVEKNLSGLGLGIAEFRILRTLHDSGESPMARLSSETLLTQAAITAIVDRLEGEELVMRHRNSKDRRVVNIGITSKGERVLVEALKTHKRFTEGMLAALNDRELLQLSFLMEKLSEREGKPVLRDKDL
ncbi:MAG: MarR family winged helix-turn-helix transcriptional regulator [Nitrososphaerales archaeon]